MSKRSVDLLDPSALTNVPWKNGAGTTVEIASDPLDFDRPMWRFSIANLTTTPTRFSSFSGMNRVFTIVGDAGVRLAFPTRSLDVGRWNPVTFSGDEEPVCTAEAETRALNVVVDGARATAAVSAHDLATTSFTTDAGSITLILVGDGHVEADSIRATAGQCLLNRETAVQVSGSASILVATVVPDTSAQFTPS